MDIVDLGKEMAKEWGNRMENGFSKFDVIGDENLDLMEQIEFSSREMKMYEIGYLDALSKFIKRISGKGGKNGRN